jgi:hypothetical protein
MSAFTVVSVLGEENNYGRMKKVIFSSTGTASYDTGGSAVDLSTAGVLGTLGFGTVLGVQQIDCDTAASSKYLIFYLHGSGPTNGLLKVHDSSAASDAEISSTTDIHATTWRFVAWGY